MCVFVGVVGIEGLSVERQVAAKNRIIRWILIGRADFRGLFSTPNHPSSIDTGPAPLGSNDEEAESSTGCLCLGAWDRLWTPWG